MRMRAAAVAGGAALALAAGLAGCTPSTPAITPQPTMSDVEPPSDGSAAALPPSIVAFADAAVPGAPPTSVELPLSGMLVITPPDGASVDSKDWTATIEDPSVVSFVAPRDDGSAQYHPGFTAQQEGETIARLTYTGGGAPQTAVFDIQVIGP